MLENVILISISLFLKYVFIQVDFGDGSGVSKWTRENSQDLWRHSYSQAGTYFIAITVTGVYDMFVQREIISLTVTETVAETDQIEIICPDVIHPGDYFNCVVDIPTGSGLTADVTITDDTYNDTEPVSTGIMNVPGIVFCSF